MAAGIQAHSDQVGETSPPAAPAVSLCESRPGTAVFLESGNTDGWIATDCAVDVIR